MPCRDDYPEGWPDRTREVLLSQNDTLAQQLCKARSLIAKLASNGVPEELRASVDEQLEAFRIHREHDKKRAIEEVDKELNELVNRIKKIKELGGTPQTKLNDRQVNLLQKRKALVESDCLQTKLY